MMCEHLKVTRAGFYAWQSREASERSKQDARLLQQVRDVHARSRGFYGSPRVTEQLRLDGVCVGKRRIARLMRLAGLQGRSARLYRQSKVAQRAFFASVPFRADSALPHALNQVWVGDVTYLRVAGQWRYLAVVMDRHSRRILGWSLGPRRDAALTSRALRHAARNRADGASAGVLFHSDRGVEYAAFEFRTQLAKLGMLQSMNRAGKMNDNAHMESFFHSMKTEDLYGRKFRTDIQLRHTLSSYIAFYNQQRLHSSLCYLPPVAFEQREAQQAGVN
jgi:putative transposase